MRRQRTQAFTLVELLVVVAILGVLATLVIPAYGHLVLKAKISRAVSEIRVIEKDIVAQMIEKNTLPNALNDIGRGTLLDPWGNPYQYLKIGNPGAPREFIVELNTDFDLYSMGPDGLTQQVITDANSLDDVLRASDGNWVGVAEKY